MSLLEVEGLAVSFTQYEGLLRQKKIQVVNRLDLRVKEGQINAIIGASGSGKSLLAHAIMGLLPANAKLEGIIRYRGEILDAGQQRRLRGREIALVPQSVTALDPLRRAGDQLPSPLLRNPSSNKLQKLFNRLRLDFSARWLYPFQLSGGMARKVLLGTAELNEVRLIIADEPTPGLHENDVAAALSWFKQQAEQGCGVLFISHDLQAALSIADVVTVMFEGRTIESARVEDFSGAGELLRHPYTKAMWQALPQNGFTVNDRFLEGLMEQLTGCPFALSCELADEQCYLHAPDMRPLREGKVRCFHAT